MKILTFDIEDWFHILDNPSTSKPEYWEKFPSRLETSLDFILEELVNNNQKATFFILGWVAKKYPNQIKKIADSGFHIGSHSFAHQLVYQQSKNEFEEDLKKSILQIEDIIGKKIEAYRAPGFSIKEGQVWALEKLVDYGITIDSSIFPASRGHGGFPSFPFDTPTKLELKNGELMEFPLNYKSIFGAKVVYSGGGYFRLFPKFVLQNWFKNSEYIMTYFHPRDFDPEQPMIKELSYTRRFKSYYGLGRAKEKLTKILQENQFISLEEAAKTINENSENLKLLKLGN